MRRPLLCLLALVTLSGCSVPRWPVDGRLSSPFGLRRDGLSFAVHRGVDIVVPTGTEVRAMGPGQVSFAGTMSGYGKVIVVDHAGGIRTVYAHLSEIRVQKGQDLRGRPVIGLSGSSGRTTGPHLHFEVQHNGSARDPVPLLGGPPRPRGP
jgi:murein DD-endopeptidase MepM/ murein hydrolase activator NlpD